jgi:hypothetical protein
MWPKDNFLALEIKINGLTERINELRETINLILRHLKVEKVVYPEQRTIIDRRVTLEPEKKSKKK